MAEIVIELFKIFAYETGILGAIRKYEEIGMICMLALAVIAIVMGLMAYRAIFSAVMFLTIATASSMLLGGWMDWGEVVTCFAVLGTFIAFLAYKWDYLGGVILGMLVVGSACLTIGAPLIVTILSAVLSAVLIILFPVISICLFTAFWGSCVLVEILQLPYAILIILGLTTVGFSFQMLTNRKQTIFTKKYPAVIKHWLEQRKRGSEC